MKQKTEAAILKVIESNDGITCDELADHVYKARSVFSPRAMLGMWPDKEPFFAAAKVFIDELKNQGKIIATSKRKCSISGVDSDVWRLV